MPPKKSRKQVKRKKSKRLKLTDAHIGCGVVLKSMRQYRYNYNSVWPFRIASIKTSWYVEVMVGGSDITFLVKKSDIKKVF